MSIYFVHFFSVFLPLAFLSAVFIPKITPKSAITCIVVGSVFAYIANFIAVLELQNDNLFFITNILLYVILLLLFIAYFIPKTRQIPLLFDAIFAFLIFGFFVRYLYMSVDFKIFAIGFLESVSIISFGLVILALIATCVVFFLVKSMQKSKLALLLGIIIFAILLNALTADILYALVRKGVLDSGESLIRYIGRSIYYAFLNPYVCVAFVLVLGLCSLFAIPRNVKKNALFDIDYRKNLGVKNYIKSTFFINICVAFVSCGILLYYDLYASKPISIDKATILERPQDDIFSFDVKLLSDNRLHRFAYISDEGKEIRFFLLNKFEDRTSPAVAFDACALCGDMGYIKKGGELICIACNVRIFLPSVGKFGGCNPIPLPFINEGGFVKIKLDDVLSGANFFSKIVSKEVIDPVNKEKLLNTEALFSYKFNGILYFFNSQESYDAFIKEPEKYVKSDITALYTIQKYHAESN